MKKVAILVTAVLMFCMQMLTACYDETETGLKIGFEWGGYYAGSNSIECAVKSDVPEFDKDNVYLDFYYGWRNPIKYDENRVCYALYFLKSKLNLISNGELIYDYTQIEYYYFVKEISVEEFSSDKYAMEDKKGSGKRFNHHETLTVPEEFFTPVVEDSLAGGFTFLLLEIRYSQKDYAYFVGKWTFVTIRYNFNEKNLRLNPQQQIVIRQNDN